MGKDMLGKLDMEHKLVEFFVQVLLLVFQVG
jgi:hypothetical protein